MMTRRELADRAIQLVGGTAGLVYRQRDPDGFFELVTEGRQAFHGYSACEELASKLAFDACDGKMHCVWSNRVEAGNKWIPGQNLIRIKQHAAFAWREYSPGCTWDIALGDCVQIMNRFGAHTFAIVELRYDADGNPTSCDTAEYGQYFDGGPACRMYLNKPIARDRAKRWTIDGCPVIGRLSIVDLAAHEHALDAYPEPDGAA